MKRERSITLITQAAAVVFGPRVQAALAQGQIVDVAGWRLKLQGVEPVQAVLELS